MQLITPCSLSADHTARVAWEHSALRAQRRQLQFTLRLSDEELIQK